MTNVLDAILDVFSAVSTWIVEAVQGVIPMFYAAETGLTFLGVLAVAGLAMSVVFLLFFRRWAGHGATHVQKYSVNCWNTHKRAISNQATL